MRSHYCGELNESHLDQTVLLYGWVHRRRDHGGVIFLDVRDREGIAQVVYDPDTVESFAIAEDVRNEFVIKIVGRVRLRPEGTVNPDMSTGKIEVLGKELEYLIPPTHRLFSSMNMSMYMKTFGYDIAISIYVVRK